MLDAALCDTTSSAGLTGRLAPIATETAKAIRAVSKFDLAAAALKLGRPRDGNLAIH